MPKKKPQSIARILKTPLKKLMSMSREDLAKETSKLVSAANKRLRRFEKAGITTPATAYVEKHGGRFSTAGKTIEQLREEFQRLKGFFEAETSTRQGYNRWERRVASAIEERTGADYSALSPEEKSLFWKAYAHTEEANPDAVHGGNYSDTMEQIVEDIQNGRLTAGNVKQWAIDRAMSVYNPTQEAIRKEESPLDIGSN